MNKLELLNLVLNLLFITYIAVKEFHNVKMLLNKRNKKARKRKSNKKNKTKKRKNKRRIRVYAKEYDYDFIKECQDLAMGKVEIKDNCYYESAVKDVTLNEFLLPKTIVDEEKIKEYFVIDLGLGEDSDKLLDFSFFCKEKDLSKQFFKEEINIDKEYSFMY